MPNKRQLKRKGPKSTRRWRQAEPRRAALLSRPPLLSVPSSASFPSLSLPASSLVRAADVPSRPIPYFWPPAIAFGKVTVILAPTAACTSALMAELGAKASVGGELPQTQGPMPVTDTAIVAAGVAIVERVRPQLDAAGADPCRVHFLGPSGSQTPGIIHFDPKFDSDALMAAIRSCGNIQLVVVEFTIPRIDGNIAQAYKAVLESFYALARKLDVAVVVLFHPAGGPPACKEMALAASAIGTVDAVGFVAREIPGGRWLLVWAKNIVGHDAPGVAFRIEAKTTEGGILAAVIAWDPEPVSTAKVGRLLALSWDRKEKSSALQRAKEFLLAHVGDGKPPQKVATIQKLAAAAGIKKGMLTRARNELGIAKGPENELAKLSAVKQATEFLQAELANGPVLAKVILRKAKEADISNASVRRACKELKIKSTRQGGLARKGRWIWQLPSSN